MSTNRYTILNMIQRHSWPTMALCVSVRCGWAVVHRVENIPRNLMCSHETLSKSSLVGCGIPWMLVNRTLHSHRHHHCRDACNDTLYPPFATNWGNWKWKLYHTQHTPIFVFILRTCECVDVMVGFCFIPFSSRNAHCSMLIDHWWQRYLYGVLFARLFFSFFSLFTGILAPVMWQIGRASGKWKRKMKEKQKSFPSKIVFDSKRGKCTQHNGTVFPND